MPINTFTKFGKDWMRITQVRERTVLILDNFGDQRATTPEPLGRSRWLSNSSEILCP